MSDIDTDLIILLSISLAFREADMVRISSAV